MNMTWLLGFTLGMIGAVGHFTYIQYVSEYNFLFLLVGFILVAMGGPRGK